MRRRGGTQGCSSVSPATDRDLGAETIDELTRVGAELAIDFGIDGPELTCLAHAHNVTFRVDGLRRGQRRSYSLRLYRAGIGTTDRVAAESLILSHLHDHGVAAPVPVPDQTGTTVHTTRAVRNGKPRTALLCNWIEGEIPTTEVFRAAPDRLGRELARVHEALAALDSRQLRAARPRWDAAGMDGRVVGADPDLADTIATPVERALLRRARSTAGAVLDSLVLSGHRASLIHSDPRRANVLVASGEFAFIDFEGCGWGQPAYDFAVLISDLLRDQPHGDKGEFLASALAAYRELRTLSAEQEEAVAPLLAGRLAVHLTWYLSSTADPLFPRDVNFRALQAELLARTLPALRTNPALHRPVTPTRKLPT
ncbi:phosphotransferase enzyme family protein [Kribbella sp. NPDC051620]|uniref:phosphotransferase enzyme family protein n=1 Tax=Kribbella sp. NPDC051620 TaxID=3364120 RepID=UPI0037B8C909